MHEKTTLSWNWQALAAIILALAAHSASAQYVNQGYQLQATQPLLGGPNMQLSIQPGASLYPLQGPAVSAYSSFVWSTTNGVSTLPYAATYTNSNTYASLALLSYTAASNASVAQVIQGSTGAAFYITSEYNRQFTSEGAWVDVLVGHYLHATGPLNGSQQVLPLAHKPLRLALSENSCASKIFVLENDGNSPAVIEAFTLDPADCNTWRWSNAVSLSSGMTPVEMKLAGGKIAVVGNQSVQCWVTGGQVWGLGGVLQILDLSLSSQLVDFTACRADGNFLFLKGFARDATENVAVVSNQIYLYGDILWATGPYHLAYYAGVHNLTVPGFIEIGLYPTPVPPDAPQSTALAHAGRHSLARTTALSSVGVSSGAILSGGFLYLTGTATSDGYNQVAKTAQFNATGGLVRAAALQYPNSAGIALDNGVIYVGAGGQVGANYYLAFQAYDSNLTPVPGAAGQKPFSPTVSHQTVPSALLLRHYSNHLPDVFLAGSVLSPDSQHMYTGFVTQFNFLP